MTVDIGKCPVCGKAGDAKFRPFCSKRCSVIDLGGWLDEKYRVSMSEDDEAEALMLESEQDNG